MPPLKRLMRGMQAEAFRWLPQRIRNLAESSSASAKEIGNTTKELIQAIHGAEKEIEIDQALISGYPYGNRGA